MSESNNENAGLRYIFNGTNAKPMFHIEKVPLPELNDGEILVKVRTATICLSDIHTVCGTRIEPTPR
jgi:D-arabinose 1-dehydrogenase-like Zn-dependent alcohol dehydrogenase